MSFSGKGINERNGWIYYDTVIPTRSSADDPIYVISFSGVDLTFEIYQGMRVTWVQNSILRVGIVVAAAFSTNTTLTIYGGTANDVEDTATFPITQFGYSHSKAPLYFDNNHDLWSVETADTSRQSQATPAASTWYNAGSISIDIPIGSWVVTYEGTFGAQIGSAGNVQILCTLSTGSSTESDSELSAFNLVTGVTRIFCSVKREKVVTVASKTTYYLNISKGGDAGSYTQIEIAGDLQGTIIRLVSAYV